MESAGVGHTKRDMAWRCVGWIRLKIGCSKPAWNGVLLQRATWATGLSHAYASSVGMK
jgi:hypothetical protein